MKNSAAAVGLRRRKCASIFFILHFSLFIFLLTSCSTQKAKWVNVQYHNVTCHYNVWWNGNESLKAGREKLYKAAVDDYTRLLLPENLGTETEAGSVNPEMDRAIEKSVKGIKKHSIFIKGEEHVPYIKECYLLSAYATFYKQDFVSTYNTCSILVTQFSGTHAGDEGAVLIARCLVREKRYAEAEAALDQLVVNLGKGNFTRSQRGKLYVAMVEATVPQEKYKKAVEYIRLAIECSGSSREKARLTFLMAQIYQQLDKRPVAAKYYHKVLSYGPEYVMEFNARIGEASCADLEHSDINKLERQLDAMLRDKKNEEYRDQIYYAKGEMFLGVKDAQRACDNYRLSVAVSTNNPSCKARSAIRLGEVLYEQYENYDIAQIYYDTAMQIIKPDYPRYKSIKSRYDILTELVSFTRVYERNDSILAVAALPEAERMALIQTTIDTLKKREQEARERELIAEMMADSKSQANTLTGDWYFYNANTVQKGKVAFRQRWGVRPLEDLWCLTNKQMISSYSDTLSESNDDQDFAGADSLSADSSAVATSASKYGNPEDPHDIAYYLKDLPTSQRQYDSIDSLNAVALLGAAYIFYDGLGNTPRALDCYLRLAKDYTSYDDIVQAFFMLYRIFDRQGNTPQANYYRDMVLRGFPDSDFANLIRDNEYYRELIARNQRIEDDYEQLYNLYRAHRFTSAITLADQAEELYPGNPLLPRFRFWRALSTAVVGDRQSAISQLESIVAISPQGDSIIPIAQSQLELLRADSSYLASQHDENITERDEKRVSTQDVKPQQPSTSGIASQEEELPPEARIFRYRERQQYYAVIIVNDRKVKATELQYQLSDFNSQYYSNSGYKVNALLFTDTTQLITVHRFVDDEEAMRYYRHLTSDQSPLSQLSDADHVEFIISTQNYATFYNRKNIDAYMAYFRKYHLNKKN